MKNSHEPGVTLSRIHHVDALLHDAVTIILSNSANLVRLIDLYTILKTIATGIPHNVLSECRRDAVSITRLAAMEHANPNDKTFSEKDIKKADKILQSLGISP